MAKELATLQLREALQSAFYDWDGDFAFTIEHEDLHRHFEYFDVTIKHERLGPAYDFRMRVSMDGDCQFDRYEDSWAEISKAELFANMWFEAVMHPSREVSSLEK